MQVSNRDEKRNAFIGLDTPFELPRLEKWTFGAADEGARTHGEVRKTRPKSYMECNTPTGCILYQVRVGPIDDDSVGCTIRAAMVINQTAANLLGTAMIVSLGVLFSNSRVSDINSRLSATNGRIDAMQQNVSLALQNMTAVIRAEGAKTQAGMECIEGVLDARLRHVEEKLGIR
jgi:hypothetical protein